MAAAEGHDTILAARIAVNADKTSLLNAAIKKTPQVIFNKPGYYTPALLLERQKRFEVFSHRSAQNALFRSARLIFKSWFADAKSPGCKQKLFLRILLFFMKNR
jgi:hypothetical protein